jgi:hypothetical protein
MIYFSKISLYAFGSGSTGYSTTWKNNIKNWRSQRKNNTPVITLSSPLIIDTYIIETSQDGIACIVSLSIKIQFLLSY